MSSEPSTTQAPAPTIPAPTVEPSDLAEDPAQDAAHDRHDQRTRRRGASRRRSRCRRATASSAGGLAASGSPLSTTAMIWSTPALMPCANLFSRNSGAIVSAMMRRDVASVSDALEAVADLDAQLAVVLGDDEQRAVVLALAADLPRVGDADRVRLDRLGLRRRHDQHRELVAGLLLPRRELRVERLRVRRRQRAGEVGDARVQRRHRVSRGPLACVGVATARAPAWRASVMRARQRELRAAERVVTS